MNHYEASSKNHFTASQLNRLAEQRKDESWVQKQLNSSASRFLPIWQNKNLLGKNGVPHPITLTAREAAHYESHKESILLGQLEQTTYFALPLDRSDEPLTHLGTWEELRWQASLLPHDEASLVVYAKAMTYWHNRNKYCGDCGQPTVLKEAGHMRACCNPETSHLHFPRTDPAVIVLIYKDNKCLLARNATWPEGNYSTIAGFVEPGESLEDAVKREAKEETGVSVKTATYHSSQPWSFPASLMVGYFAEAETVKINLEDNELEEASWFTRKDLKERVYTKAISLPPPLAIAHRLLETWYDQGDEGTFAELDINLRHA